MLAVCLYLLHWPGLDESARLSRRVGDGVFTERCKRVAGPADCFSHVHASLSRVRV